MIPARTRVRVEGLSFKLKTQPGSEIRTVDVTLALPLSGELASAMGRDIFDHCFIEGRNDAGRTFEVRDEVSDIAFRLPETVWRMALYAAPDQPHASVEIVDATVTKFRVKRVKDLPLLDGRIVVSAALPGSNDVYRLISLLGDAHFVEFTDDQGCLFMTNVLDDLRQSVERMKAAGTTTITHILPDGTPGKSVTLGKKTH